MIEKIVAFSAATVFFVLAGVFGLILVSHMQDQRFIYSHIDVPVRPGTEGMPDNMPANVGQRTVTNIGPGGKVTTQSYIAGQYIDAPLHYFADGFNRHIDELNEKRKSEGTTLITLDIVGLVASFITAVLELARPFLPRDKGNKKSSSGAVENRHQTSAADSVASVDVEQDESRQTAKHDNAPHNQKG